MVYEEKIEGQRAKRWTAILPGATTRKCKSELNQSTGTSMGQSSMSNH